MIKESTPEKNIIYTFKLVIIGAGGVGKTCLFNRFCFNSFNFDTSMTIGVNFHAMNMKLYDLEKSESNIEKYVANSIFDFGGQQRFQTLIPKFLGGANGALFVFDMTNFSTLEALDFWYELLIKHANGHNIPKILVGSKNDLLEDEIDENLIDQFIRDRGMYEFIPTSALANYNVLDVFKDITNLMIGALNLPYSV